MNGSGPWAELLPSPYSGSTLGLPRHTPGWDSGSPSMEVLWGLRDWNLGGLACFPMNSYLRATLWIFELLSEALVTGFGLLSPAFLKCGCENKLQSVLGGLL